MQNIKAREKMYLDILTNIALIHAIKIDATNIDEFSSKLEIELQKQINRVDENITSFDEVYKAEKTMDI